MDLASLPIVISDKRRLAANFSIYRGLNCVVKCALNLFQAEFNEFNRLNSLNSVLRHEFSNSPGWASGRLCVGFRSADIAGFFVILGRW